MIEIKVDGYTLFEINTPKDVGHLMQQIADLESSVRNMQEINNDRLTEIANLRDERDALRAAKEQGRREALEEAAKIFDERTSAKFPNTAKGMGFSFSQEWDFAKKMNRACAEAIRSLK